MKSLLTGKDDLAVQKRDTDVFDLLREMRAQSHRPVTVESLSREAEAHIRELHQQRDESVRQLSASEERARLAEERMRLAEAAMASSRDEAARVTADLESARRYANDEQAARKRAEEEVSRAAALRVEADRAAAKRVAQAEQRADVAERKTSVAAITYTPPVSKGFEVVVLRNDIGLVTKMLVKKAS